MRRRPTRLALAVVASAMLCVAVLKSPWNDHRVLTYDVYGYSMYLSAALIYHDLGSPRPFDRLENTYPRLGDTRGNARHLLPNGNVAFKYTMGVAVMHAPLYIVAHLYALLSGSHPADGYSTPYQLAVALSNGLWGLLALAAIARLLGRWFDEAVAAAVVLMIGLGTNFMNYAALEPGMSHLPSMFLFAATLVASLSWLDRPRSSLAIVVGTGIGLTALVRLTDLVFLIVPGAVFLHHLATSDAGDRRYHQALVAGAVALLVCFPQVAYWRLMTGSWLHYSYVGEVIDLSHPHVWEGLMSYRKGWLLYTPMMTLGLLGLPLFIRKVGWLGTAVLVFTAANVYVVFSWPNWWYGGSFGARALIQSYAVLALPMASCVETIVARTIRAGTGLSGKAPAVALGAFIVLATGLNLFQTAQYDRGVLHHAIMNRAAYREVFGTWRISAADYRRLYPESQYTLDDERTLHSAAPRSPARQLTLALIGGLVLAFAGLLPSFRAMQGRKRRDHLTSPPNTTAVED